MRLPGNAVSPAFVPFALAVLLFLFTVVAFLSRSEGRRWPAWVDLALSVLIAAVGFRRAQLEGVEMRLTARPGAEPPGGDAGA